MISITYDEVKQAFEQRGYTLVSTEYIGVERKLEYICSKHVDKGIQKIDYSHFKRGQGCRYCGKENKKSGLEKELGEYNAKELTESKGMEFVDITRENSVLYVYYVCPRHRQYGVQKTMLESMRRKKIGCPYCVGKNKTTETFKKELYVLNPNILVLGEYINAKTKILCECLIDGNKWAMTPNSLLRGQGCPECGKTIRAMKRSKTTEGFKKELYLVSPEIELIGEYTGIKSKMNFRCLECGHTWETTGDSVLNDGSKCPKCIASKNEKRLLNIFTNFGYVTKGQKRYDDCRDILPLPFDVYIPVLNLLIEYQGEHHYMPIPRGSMTQEDAVRALKVTQRHDQIKTQYCIDNKIPLIKIPYWESKNLESFLMQKLEELNINIVNN